MSGLSYPSEVKQGRQLALGVARAQRWQLSHRVAQHIEKGVGARLEWTDRGWLVYVEMIV